MAERGSINEKIITFPEEFVSKINGFSFDFGGSVIKIVYISKEDQENGYQDRIRLVSFAREEFNVALEYLKKHCLIRRCNNDDKPTVFTTGLGGFQYAKKVENYLNIKTKNLEEADCFDVTIEYLMNNIEIQDFCIQQHTEAAENGWKSAMQQVEHQVNAQKQGHNSSLELNDNPMSVLEKQYPSNVKSKEYALGIFGSATGILKKTADGTTNIAHHSFFGGRSFLGLGCLLTGAKNYREIMELAEKGNNLNLDMTASDLLERSEDSKTDDYYSQAADDMQNHTRPIFMWAKGIGKEIKDFKKEDLARTLLYTMCYYMSTIICDAMVMQNVRHFYIASSLMNHPLSQQILTEEFEFRKWFNAGLTRGMDGNYHLHILDYGSYLGALGAMIKGHDIPIKIKSRQQ